MCEYAEVCVWMDNHYLHYLYSIFIIDRYVQLETS